MVREKPPHASTAAHIELPTLIWYLIPPCLVTTFLTLTSTYTVDLVEMLSAFLLLFIPWVGFLRWRQASTAVVPLFPLITFMYWLFYALPLFWGDRDDLGAGSRRFHLSDQAATDSMMLAGLGVLAIWCGIKVGIGRKWAPGTPPEIRAGKRSIAYVRTLLVIGVVLSVDSGLAYALGEEGRQIITALQKDVPMFAFAFLFQRYLQGTALKVDKYFLLGYLVISFFIGISSGWLGSFAIILIICGILYIAERKKIPVFLIVILAIYILFFQVGKNAVRGKYWYGQEEASRSERMEFWFNESLNQWQNALTDPKEGSVQKLAYQSLARLSLLNQTGNVLQQTPDVVPYQYGQLYSYLAITLVPRLIWSDKPSVNDANRFYQVSYGLTPEKDLDKISIAVGVLTESYINFGWLGIGVMFLLGILFDFVQKAFLSRHSGEMLGTIGIVLIPYLVIIEAQMAQYLGGLIQKIFVLLIVLAPILYIRRMKKPVVISTALQISTPRSLE
jgi:hypothetical protein